MPQRDSRFKERQAAQLRGVQCKTDGLQPLMITGCVLEFQLRSLFSESGGDWPMNEQDSDTGAGCFHPTWYPSNG